MSKRASAQESSNAWSAIFSKKAKKNIEKKDYSTHRYTQLIPERTDTNLKIVAWNVNGIRAVLKNPEDMEAYVCREDPDIICFSETKVHDPDLVPSFCTQYPFRTWHCATKKGYSGTLILSKKKPITTDKVVVQGENEGRFIAQEYESFYLIHTYVPNAGAGLVRLEYRTKTWDPTMLVKLQELEKSKPIIWCGDLNVCHEDIDIHDPKSNRNKSPGFTDAERANMTSVLQSGFIDVYRHFHPEKVQYTYWSYRGGARPKNKGWRLDYFIISPQLLEHVKEMETRDMIMGSDHCPIMLQITL